MSKWVFSAGFLLVLWLPIVNMVTGFPKQPTLEENRKPTPFPIFKSWGSISQYTRGSVNWFDDNYGFRDFLIRLKTQVDYSLFGMSTRVHVGSDGWLFYRSVMDVEKPRVEIVLKKDADAVVEGTRRLANTLAARGVKLIIMVAPMKDVYYSESLPKTARRLSAPRQVDLLQDRFRSMKEIVFLDSETILKEVSSRRHVFHKTDFHWNDPAAFEVAKALVNELGQFEGKANPVWAHKLEVEEKSFSGGEAKFMPIFFPPAEIGLFVKSNWIQPPYKYVEKRQPFDWIYELDEADDDRLLAPIVVLGDSFFDGMMRSGMGLYFKKISQANWNRASLNDVLGNLPEGTRYLLLEFIEVSTGSYAGLAAERLGK